MSRGTTDPVRPIRLASIRIPAGSGARRSDSTNRTQREPLRPGTGRRPPARGASRCADGIRGRRSRTSRRSGAAGSDDGAAPSGRHGGATIRRAGPIGPAESERSESPRSRPERRSGRRRRRTSSSDRPSGAIVGPGAVRLRRPRTDDRRVTTGAGQATDPIRRSDEQARSHGDEKRPETKRSRLARPTGSTAHGRTRTRRRGPAAGPTRLRPSNGCSLARVAGQGHRDRGSHVPEAGCRRRFDRSPGRRSRRRPGRVAAGVDRRPPVACRA